MKKQSLFLLPVAAIAAVFSGCSKSSSSAPPTTANVMFVNGCAAGATAITLSADNNGVALPGASSLNFLAYSGYQSITAGSGIALSFQIKGLSGLDTGVETLAIGSNYSAFAGGSITSAPFVFTSDDLTAPSSGNAKVRFINLSPDNQAMDCYLGAVKVDSGVAYLSCTPFIEVPAASSEKIEMLEHAYPQFSALISTQTLSAGRIYTFMYTGESAVTTGASVLTLTAITNN